MKQGKASGESVNEFLKFWISLTERMRGIYPMIGGADAGAVKRALQIVSIEDLEKMSILYLADKEFREMSPTPRVMIWAPNFNKLLEKKKHQLFERTIDSLVHKYLTSWLESEKLAEKMSWKQQQQR